MLAPPVARLMGVRLASTYYDVVVVGGGMVGNAMACSIGTNPHLASKSVLLLEGGKAGGLPATPPVNYSNRVSAVSPISVEMFRRLGVWDRLQSYRVKKVDKLHVLDSCSRAEIEFDQPRHNQEIAYIIENDAIVSVLYDRIKSECSSIEVKTGAAVKMCTLPGSLNDLATVQLESGETIETSLVIGADGGKSRVRDAMNVDFSSWNYEQSGVVATLQVEVPSNNIAWQRFSRQGPIALLPLSDTLSSLVWTTTTEEARRLVALPAEQFIDELNHALFTEEDQNSIVNQALFLLSRLPMCSSTLDSGDVMPHVLRLQSDTRASFPLGFGHAHSYISTRAAVVGDAAHRVHPLAGQGVNLGWNDVLTLTKTMEKMVKQGADLGSLTYLKEYDSSAQKHNVPVMVSIDWLNRLYRTDAAPLVMMRSLGLAAVNRMTPLKDFFIHRLSTAK